jgi:hypothetical protein
MFGGISNRTVSGASGKPEGRFSVSSDPDLSGPLSLRTVFGGISNRTRCTRRRIEGVLLSPEGNRFTPRSFSISHAEAEDEISPFTPPEGGVII